MKDTESPVEFVAAWFYIYTQTELTEIKGHGNIEILSSTSNVSLCVVKHILPGPISKALNPCFKIKQSLFIFQEINQVVLWDKIIKRGEKTVIELKRMSTKYYFFDDGSGGLRCSLFYLGLFRIIIYRSKDIKGSKAQ